MLAAGWPAFIACDGNTRLLVLDVCVRRGAARVRVMAKCRTLPQPMPCDPVPETMNSFAPGTGAIAPNKPADSFCTPDVK